jgi:cytochrome c biogenesis protein CcdA
MKSGPLAAAVVQDLNHLVSLEVDLAKQELKELAVTNGIAAASFAIAGILAGIALLVAVPVIVVVAVPWHWQAAVVWAVAYALIAAGLALYGRMRLQVSLPQKTITSLKETKEWALQRMRSAGK